MSEHTTSAGWVESGLGAPAREAGRGLLRGAGWAAIAVGVAVLAGSTLAMLRGVEPFATWYYPFAWYATLLVLDGVVVLSRGQRGRGGGLVFLLDRPAYLATLLGWSVVTWLFFELVNFRLSNWYYVFLPESLPYRWIGTIASFATVFPAAFLAAEVLAGLGVAESTRWPKLRVTPGLLRGMRVAGGLMLVLPLLWPKYFFPLIWGATTLLVEPYNYRRDPERSLLGDLERGRPARILRLLLGGAAIGFLWEMYNIRARGKWIYTVPGLEELKLFEMPLLGFLGFPPFALECYTIWQSLVLAGVAVPHDGRAFPASRARRWGTAVAAVVFSVLVLRGMERYTIGSYTPRLHALEGVPAAALERAGYDAFSLARASSPDIASVVGVEPEEAQAWIEAARLAVLRGIGCENANRLKSLGIRSVTDLAAQEPHELADRLRTITGARVRDAQVRLWVRAAQRATAGG
ncbi:MAG TPA: DUF4332 domain-containing protein [Longimicrobiales bacterium]